jgi:hypothetical protein
MANEARFYWSMMDRAVAMYRTSDNEMEILDKVQDECCKLVNEFRCPRLIHVEAWVSFQRVCPSYSSQSRRRPFRNLTGLDMLAQKLRSRCFPYDYWFAKHQLDCALEVVAKCEKLPNMAERDFAGLAQAKKEVEDELRDRTTTYQDWWKTEKGRDPAPEEDEWYELEEAQQIAAGGGEIYQAASSGGPYTGSDWPFPDLNGKYFHRALLNSLNGLYREVCGHLLLVSFGLGWQFY